ncbi:MAG: UDP-N-acetylmuramoyl-L-alanyl-D-glutamate--2,6-diaminopimelate ligase [Oscillospiraceae bacterium]|nr:UDP-N-acetylmuramoyl-L-alanyl-D-glutamate--2,6-diaminopimelate ligase [Oscillospiraceae bacterium]
MAHSLISLIKDVHYELISGTTDKSVSSIVYDSRKVTPGCVFVCIHGHVYDSHQYIPDGLEKGASVIVVSSDQDLYLADDFQEMSEKFGAAFIATEDTRIALAQMSMAFFDEPSKKLELIGITGTKGKTTTTYMVHGIFTAAGKKSGMIGTIANISAGEVKQADRTTPEAFDLQKMLSEMVEAGSDSCVMEVSSLGLQFDRVYGCEFLVGAFTNLHLDHISQTEHADMREYLNAKLIIFEQSKNAVVNFDCSVGREVAEYAKRFGPVYTYGLSEECECRAESIRRVRKKGITGTEFLLKSPWFSGNVFVALPGLFNVFNALCAIAISGICGISFEAIREALGKITVPGRLQMIPNLRNITVLVDYAHNAASLEILLETLREYCHGRLITVFGCGGNRSTTRRSEMGEVSGRLSDLTVVTSDNPRNEEPMEIIQGILSGMERTSGAFIIEPDRKTAIEKAIVEARPEDFVIIAGKGHENYQIFKDQTIHFDDAEVAAEILGHMSDTQNG